MTSRAPFYEGVEGQTASFPRTQISGQCPRSFSVHSGWIFFFFFLLPLCYLLYSQGTICCFLLITKQGSSGNYHHTDQLCRVPKANFMSRSDL